MYAVQLLPQSLEVHTIPDGTPPAHELMQNWPGPHGRHAPVAVIVDRRNSEAGAHPGAENTLLLTYVPHDGSSTGPVASDGTHCTIALLTSGGTVSPGSMAHVSRAVHVAPTTLVIKYGMPPQVAFV